METFFIFYFDACNIKYRAKANYYALEHVTEPFEVCIKYKVCTYNMHIYYNFFNTFKTPSNRHWQ